MKMILAHRKAHQSLAVGQMAMVDSDDRLLVFRRTLGAESTLCGFNLSSETVEFSILNSGPRGKNHAWYDRVGHWDNPDDGTPVVVHFHGIGNGKDHKTIHSRFNRERLEAGFTLEFHSLDYGIELNVS